jgi:hypothetical protein
MPKPKMARDPHGHELTAGDEAYVVGMPPHPDALMPEIRFQKIISISPNNHFAFTHHSTSGRPKYTDSRFVFHDRQHAISMIRKYLADKAAADIDKLQNLKERARESHGAMLLAQDESYDFAPTTNDGSLNATVAATNERVRLLGKSADV